MRLEGIRRTPASPDAVIARARRARGNPVSGSRLAHHGTAFHAGAVGGLVHCGSWILAAHRRVPDGCGNTAPAIAGAFRHPDAVIARARRARGNPVSGSRLAHHGTAFHAGAVGGLVHCGSWILAAHRRVPDAVIARARIASALRAAPDGRTGGRLAIPKQATSLRGARHRALLNQPSLALVPLARATPRRHDRRQRRVLPGPPCQGRITGGEKKARWSRSAQVRSPETGQKGLSLKAMAGSERSANLPIRRMVS